MIARLKHITLSAYLAQKSTGLLPYLLPFAFYLLPCSFFAQTTVTFNCTGSSQNWTVPPCVTSINVVVKGAQGGGANGGNGATVSATLSVTPGQVLQINVGCRGNCPGSGGFGGGGSGPSATSSGCANASANAACGGGGASDIKISPYGIGNKLIVAGGGGGMGGGDTDAAGGTGGCNSGGTGGSPFGQTGSGGTQSAGGTGGAPWISSGNAGQNGSLGNGGNGGSDPCYNVGPGGGGGGGYYGGGGGGSDCYANCSLGGGAGSGGSSLVPSGGSCTGGNNSGNGQVTITYTTGSATVSVNSPTICSGQSTALNATVSPAGGTYSWNTGATTSSINVSPGSSTTYSVTYTSGGCTGTASGTVTVNPLPTVSVNSTTICAGQSATLTATVSPSGGTYSWNTGASTSSITVTPGSTTTYTVTYTRNGCSATGTGTITVNAAPSATFTYNGNQCLNGNSYNFTNTGGSGTYSWSFTSGTPSSSTTNNPTGITWTTAGTYTVTHSVTSGGCTGTSTQNITVYAQPAVSASGTNPLCSGQCNGTVSASGSGGNPGYTYTWNGGLGMGSPISNVCAGNYTVTVSDANGCTGTNSVTLNEPSVLSGSASSTNANCNGVCSGTVSSSGSGGTPAYTYTWNNGLGMGSPISNVCAGNYSVTISDANNCTTVQSTALTEPSVLNASATANPASCNGICDGSLSASAIGGASGYSFSWSGGLGSGATKSGVCAGNYTVTVTDANSCTKTATVTISSPAALVPTASGTNVSCNGGNNGSASVSVSGGTPSYSYSWSSGSASSSATGLNAGTYSVTVTDANSCTAITSVNITEPSALTATASATATSCNGSSNGNTTANPSGGTSPYSYQWDGATGFQTTQTATGLAAGTYSITITGIGGCTATASATVNQPSAISGTTTTTTANCGTATGSASVTALGGTSPYNYSWSTSPSQTSSTATGLSAGSYTVTITDANSCTNTATATVSSTGAPTATISESSNVNCFGGNNGIATVDVSGGAPPYTYAWSPSGGNAATANGLTAGTYCVNITDNNNCIVSVCTTITEPAQLSAIPTSVTNATCNGICNGSATISVSGGISPYTYLWQGGGTSATKTGLCAGNFTVIVTDSNGCGIVVPVSITEPTSVTVTPQDGATSCNGICDGAGNLTASGGTSPYTFSWDNGETVEDATSLCAGSHTVTVTDANGCTATPQGGVNVNEPAALALTLSSTNSTCGQSNGTASVAVSGGTSPYSYLWNTGDATSSVSGLPASVYTVTITDANGCIETNTVIVNNSSPGSATAIVDSNATGAGLCNGSATASMSGGNSPYSYLWGNGQTTATATGLCAGSNCVTVTDADNCPDSICITITEPPAISAAANPTAVQCFGVCNGSIDLSVSGGVSPYTYLWDNGAAPEDISNLCTGNYSVTITDANSITATATTTVNTPSEVSGTTSPNNVICNGACTGSILLTVTGGTEPYSFLWSNGQTTINANSLCTGNYSVTVTDNLGCTATAVSSITEPSPFNLTFSSTIANCGGNDGTATVSVSGGTSPYSYLWDNGVQTQNITSLQAGNYSVTITDANNCTFTGNTTVGSTPPVIATISSVLNVSCDGDCNGSAAVSAGGTGTAPFSYQWDATANNQTNDTAFSLCTGNYNVTVTDANGCTSSTTATVNSPTPLVASLQSTFDIRCFGECDGTATVDGSGGTSPYAYVWSDPLAQNSKTATGLCAGNYTATITDANGCTVTQAASITQTQDIDYTVSSIPANCNQSNAFGCVDSVSGGTSPYSYQWPSGNIGSCSVSLTAGTYVVTITDVNNCTKTASVVIQNITGPTATVSSQTNIDCNGNCNGSATASVSGGVSPYNFQWNANAGNQITPTASNLCAGMYSITITDSAGCAVSISANITEPAAISYNQQFTNPACFNGNNGTASVTVAGGTTPYSYLWNTGVQTQNIASLQAGNYSLTVTDANNCTEILNYTLTNPPQITTSTSVINASCNGLCNGQASVTVSNGTAPYSYLWSDANAQTTQQASGLCAGNYTVQITDANNCPATSSAIITEPTAISATINNFANVSCNGACNGYAQVSVSGGIPAYTYFWSNNSVSQVNSNLCSGNYTVTVTDANSCTKTASIAIIQPQAFSAVLTPTDVACGGICNGQVVVNSSGGTTPYTYLWSANASFQTTQTATGLCGGNYFVTITDSAGCQIYKNVFVFEPTPLSLVSNKSDAHCGQNDGSICINAMGGIVPYSYQWNDPNLQTSACASGLYAGCYIMNIADAAGCFSDTLICLNDIEGPTLAIDTLVNTVCNGDANGMIDFNVTGGTPNYIIKWYNNSGDSLPQYNGLTVSGYTLPAGTYTLVVTDSANCISALPQTIFQPEQINTGVTNPVNVSCNGVCSGSATIGVSGGTAPFSYGWNSGQTTATATGLCAGVFQVTITDSKFCTKTQAGQITEPTPLIVSSNSIIISCNGVCDGGITLDVSGGNGQFYLYDWNPNSAGNFASAYGLCAGTFTTTVTDANGCNAVQITVLTEPQPLNLTSNITTATCSYCNGEASVSGTGGTSPYGYSWSPSGGNAATATNLCSGNNFVTVSDANGCSYNTTLDIPDAPSPQIDSFITTQPSCNGGSNGATTVNVSGGTSPVSYLWSNGVQTQGIASVQAGTYGVTVTDANSCIAIQNVSVEQPSPLNPVTDNPDTICYGKSAQIYASGEGGTQPYTILWTGNASGFSGFGPHLVNPLMNTSYLFILMDFNNCSASDSVQIIVREKLNVTVADTVSICSDETQTICASGSGGLGNSSYAFLWSDNNTDSCQTLNAQTNQPLSVILNDGCSLDDTAQIVLFINPTPAAEFNAFDTAFCPPQNIQFAATPLPQGISVNSQWDFDGNGTIDANTSPASFLYEDSGTYDVTLIVSTAEGCWDTLTKTNYITVYPKPLTNIDAVPLKTSVLQPEIDFNAQFYANDDSLNWDLGDGSAVTGSSFTHSYNDTGTYTVILTSINKYGCEATDTEIVIIKDDFILFTPNAFSPNGDGKNDYFFPKGVGINPAQFQLWIFDRWGDIIFESNNVNSPWDGTAHGGSKPVQIGVYIWLLETQDNDGKEFRKMGYVTVVK